MAKIYLICPVRNADPAALAHMAAYVNGLEANGHQVHFPPRDVDQSDDTGVAICAGHLAAMRAADEVHVFWDTASTGSHFDLGMAFALGKPVTKIFTSAPDKPGKSYVKVMAHMHGDVLDQGVVPSYGRCAPLSADISLSNKA